MALIVMDMEAPKRKYQKHKEGYKISVKHYLRKDFNLVEKVFQNSSHIESDSPKFPLYIRVAFLQQTVKLKSRLAAKLSDEEFEDFINRPENQYFIDLEVAAVQKSIEELKPDTIENFTISQWTSYYNTGSQSLLDCLTFPLMNKFRADLQKDNNLKNIDSSIQIVISNLPMLKFFSEIQVPQAVKLVNEITPFVSIFDNNGYLSVQNSIPYLFLLGLEIWDFPILFRKVF